MTLLISGKETHGRNVLGAQVVSSAVVPDTDDEIAKARLPVDPNVTKHSIVGRPNKIPTQRYNRPKPKPTTEGLCY